MKLKNVLIIGGSGFVGKNLAAKLATQGYHIVIPTRNPERCRQLNVLPNISLVKADIHNSDELNELCQKQNMVINLLGVLHDSKKNGFRLNHIEFTNKLMSACQKNNVTRLLHMSALGADQARGGSLYLRSKGEGENLIHTFGQKNLSVTSFQPSVIYGDNDHFITRFSNLLNYCLGDFPLACPNSRFSPIHVQDLTQLMLQSINDKHTYGQKITACGPTSYSLIQIVRLIAKTKTRPCLVLPMPNIISRLFARIFQILPGKLFTMDQYKSLQTPSTCSAIAGFDYHHTLENYLTAQQKNELYATYRKRR